MREKNNSLMTRLFSGNKPAPGREASKDFSTRSAKGEVELVFESGGVNYYRFCDEQRIPAKRAFSARDVYQELEHATPREASLAFIDAILVAVDQGSLSQVSVLAQLYRDRMTYITHTDLLYKLASVLYFDSSENPASYDPIYCAKKIARWKEDNDVDAFFLKTPLIEYLPFSDLSKFDFRAFTASQRESDRKQYQVLLSKLSATSGNEDTSAALRSLMETLAS